MELPRGRVLRQLCRQGNAEMARRMLEAGVPVDAPQEDGCTGLWLAAEAGCANVVKLLAETAGANVNAVKTVGNISALYVAAQNGHVSVVDVLLVNGANPNLTKTTGATPLFIAAQQNYTEIVASLLKAGCNPNAPTAQGVTPLMIAAFQGNTDVARKLLEGGADANLVGQGRTSLDWARSNGHQLEYQRVLDDHLRDMEAEVRRRQQLLAGAAGGAGGVSRQLQVATPGSPGRHDRSGGGASNAGDGAQSEFSTESGVAVDRRTALSGRSSAGAPSTAQQRAANAGAGAAGATTRSGAAPHRHRSAAEEDAAGLPDAIQDAAATLATMDMRSAFLIPSIARAASASATPGRSHGAAYGTGTGTGAGAGAGTVNAKTSSFYTRPLGRGVGRMDRSLGAYGGMTTATIAEEERRSAEFRGMLKRDNSSVKHKSVAAALTGPDGTVSRQELYNVEQQWESHRDRVASLIFHGGENRGVLARNLAESQEANTSYALRAMELTPAFATVRQNAAEQREQSAQSHAAAPQKTSGFNFPRLPSKKLNALHAFMAEGRDAKGPPTFTDGAAPASAPAGAAAGPGAAGAPRSKEVSFL